MKRYIRQVQQAYHGGNWIDEDIEKKLKLVNEQNAFMRPDGYIHSIAEVTSHIVEWRKELIERMESGRHQKLTMESPNNWRSNESLKRDGWAFLKNQLSDSQHRLIALLENKDDEFLLTKGSGEETYEWLLVGLIEHDIYHLGQIGLIYKLVNYRSGSN